MTLKKVLVVMLACMMAISSLVTMVGCSNEISQDVAEVSVSMATSISKALNQSGQTQESDSATVADYYWQYYVTEDTNYKKNAACVSELDDSVFKAFKSGDNDVQTGLGTIQKLMKGETYVFVLRGYDKDDHSQLIWEGSSDAVKLVSKNQLITVDVYASGKGRLYFNISAPASRGFSTTSASYQDNGVVKYDIFKYSIKELDGTAMTTYTDLELLTTDTDFVSTETEYGTIYYTTEEDDGLVVPVGTYLLTIQQYAWNAELDTPAYAPVNQRKQVLLINIVSGVNTFVKGSLDSTELTVMNYEAYNEGITVNFNETSASGVVPLPVTVTTTSGAKATIKENDRVNVYDGQYITIDWTTNSDFATKISVNGDYLNLTTTTDFRTEWGVSFFKRTKRTDKNAYVASPITDTDECHSVKAYGKAGLDYLVTIEQLNEDGTEGKSMSFTICGLESDVLAKSSKTIVNPDPDGNSSYTLETVVTSDNAKIINATITGDSASAVMEDVLGNDAKGTYMTTDYDNELTLALAVKETEQTASSMSFDISMTGQVVSKEVGTDNIKNYTDVQEVHNIYDYTVVTVKLSKDLSNVSVTHSGTAMNAATDEDFTGSTSANDTNNAGFFFYESSSGILYIKTKTFSPFVISFDDCEALIGNTYYSKLSGAVAAAVEGDEVIVLKDVEITADLTINKAITLTGVLSDGSIVISAPENNYKNGNENKTGKTGIVVNLGEVTSEKNVCIKNLKLMEMGNYGAIEVSGSNNADVHVLIKNVYCDTFYRMGISVHGGTVDIDSCTIDSHLISSSVGNGINFDGYGSTTSEITATVKNCTITNSQDDDDNWASGGIALWDNVDLTVDNCTITNSDIGISPVGENNKIKVTNTTIRSTTSGLSVNKYLYENAKTCEVELGSGNSFDCSSRAIYVGFGQGHDNIVKLNITGGEYKSDYYSLILSDYASYYATEDTYDINEYLISGSSISKTAVFDGSIIVAYDAFELSTYEDSGYKVQILEDADLTYEKVVWSDCWYSNGAWNGGSGASGKMLSFISTIFANSWIADGEGIKIFGDIALDADINCNMTSGNFYLYFQNNSTITGRKIILNPGVSVISNTSGKASVFGGGTINETANGDGTYTYSCIASN